MRRVVRFDREPMRARNAISPKSTTLNWLVRAYMVLKNPLNRCFFVHLAQMGVRNTLAYDSRRTRQREKVILPLR